MPPRDEKYVNTLSRCESDVDSAIKDIRQAEATGYGAHQRQHERLPFDGPVAVQIAVEHPGGSMGRFMVKSHDISQGGLGFLHGGYIHIGAKCSATLLTSSGNSLKVDGTIVRCACLRGRVHDVGVKFTKPIEVEQILRWSKDGDGQKPEKPTYDPQTVVNVAQQLRILAAQKAPLPKLHSQFEALGRTIEYPMFAADDLRDQPENNGPA